MSSQSLLKASLIGLSTILLLVLYSGEFLTATEDQDALLQTTTQQLPVMKIESMKISPYINHN